MEYLVESKPASLRYFLTIFSTPRGPRRVLFLFKIRALSGVLMDSRIGRYSARASRQA